jgi:hypothetical protein
MGCVPPSCGAGAVLFSQHAARAISMLPLLQSVHDRDHVSSCI